MSFEGSENRAEWISDQRNNPLPNNTVPEAVLIKLLSDVTCIVANSHKDKAWPIFCLFQNLFTLTFCCCCHCCFSSSFPTLVLVISGSLCHTFTSTFPPMERGLAEAVRSPMWPEVTVLLPVGDIRVYGLRQAPPQPGVPTLSITKTMWSNLLHSSSHAWLGHHKSGRLLPALAQSRYTAHAAAAACVCVLSPAMLLQLHEMFKQDMAASREQTDDGKAACRHLTGLFHSSSTDFLFPLPVAQGGYLSSPFLSLFYTASGQ